MMFGGSVEESERFAVFSAVSYQPTLAEKRALLDKYKKVSWQIDTDLTNANATTMFNPNTGEIIFSIRGTDPKNVSDLAQDVGIITGTSRFMSRAKQMSRMATQIINKYGKDKLIVVGHSLGGELARQVSNKFGIPAVVFNRGSSIPDIFNPKSDLIKEYSNNNPSQGSIDPVSIVSYLTGKHENEYIPSKSWNTHTLDNFLNDDPNAMVGEGMKKNKCNCLYHKINCRSRGRRALTNIS
jgi:hypothetical protein